ncbi:hypothetical protein CmeUKMEL1_02945 [Cryptosporidium meleagridis]|uniref:Uncharacterized protein n=1 Tax=Cryptosporidium meleagridis TaxID=93969 RepID=A0A2P4YXL2_9CRYT|nr:hypothetical protein CmeUKMEL1_02945 [Cryptosporidium meleagridis]
MKIKESDQAAGAPTIESVEAQLKSNVGDLSPLKPEHMSAFQFLTNFGLDEQMHVKGTCNSEVKEVFINKTKKIVTFYFLYRGEYSRDYGKSNNRGKDMTANTKTQSVFVNLMNRTSDIIMFMAKYMSLLMSCIMYLLSHYYRKVLILNNEEGCTTYYIFFHLVMMEMIDCIMGILSYSKRQLVKLVARLAEGSYTDSESRIQAIDLALAMISETVSIEKEKFNKHSEKFESCKEFIKHTSSALSSRYKASKFDTSTSGSPSSSKHSFKKLFGKKQKSKEKDKREKDHEDEDGAEETYEGEDPFWKLVLDSITVTNMYDDDVFM